MAIFLQEDKVKNVSVHQLKEQYKLASANNEAAGLNSALQELRNKGYQVYDNPELDELSIDLYTYVQVNKKDLDNVQYDVYYVPNRYVLVIAQ